MDETPLSFDIPYNTSLEKTGAKTVRIRTTGYERANFTAILACMADGTKLPAVIIFKRKTFPKKEAFPAGIYIRNNESGWCNEQEMLWWVDEIWKKRNPLGNSRSLLIYDAFKGHTVDTVKDRLENKNTNIAVIPSGLTSRLQPLDVSINRSFKAKVKFIYTI